LKEVPNVCVLLVGVPRAALVACLLGPVGRDGMANGLFLFTNHWHVPLYIEFTVFDAWFMLGFILNPAVGYY
jgi:hypothetical protein